MKKLLVVLLSKAVTLDISVMFHFFVFKKFLSDFIFIGSPLNGRFFFLVLLHHCLMVVSVTITKAVVKAFTEMICFFLQLAHHFFHPVVAEIELRDYLVGMLLFFLCFDVFVFIPNLPIMLEFVLKLLLDTLN